MEQDCRHDHEPDPIAPAPNIVADAAAFFRALGEPARLRVVAELCGRELCVSELAALTGDSMSAVSQRLRVLRADGLVVRRRNGKHVHYSLCDDHVAELVRNAIEHATEPRRADSE
ncbi:MAG: metalloregulator ArsR/SmtB family transcription factor [bacterium]|nr:metalloregulator ArsR/SmtB family transcription factor [bacterium]